MIANYHTHTPRCHHATGSEEAYIQCALDAGMEILGFSDHAPYPFPAGYISSFRMDIAQLGSYVSAVLAMRKKYGRKISVALGVEAEYYPKYFHDMVAVLRDHGIEYMILGQHFLYNEVEGIGSGGPTADRSLLRQYCNQVIDAMHTGLFTYFAHPDIFCFAGDDQVYRQEMRRICQAANACGVALELNLLGLHLGRNYPNRAFWETVAEENCSVILGFDAHKPEFLLDDALYRRGTVFLNQLGITPVDTLPLRPLD